LLLNFCKKNKKFRQGIPDLSTDYLGCGQRLDPWNGKWALPGKDVPPRQKSFLWELLI
jgi:hypothetical protein